MPYYVYLLQSETDESFYKCFTENPLKRGQQHNDCEMQYTSTKIPWNLFYGELFENITDALIN